MTKREARVLTISSLMLAPELTVWDVGAGTGSLSVEAALFAPGGHVFAVEKKAEGVHLIQQNISNFGIDNLSAICGEAPDALDGLPDPHRIIVGGSGGRLDEILAYCAKRLLPGGVMVANIVTPRNLTKVLDILGCVPFINLQAVWLQASRLEPLGQEHSFRAQNGVWIVSARKEQD
jgi:precorrin-6Y C5,15-methyltransferase (decarboxylating) CbiT subunit